jgi:tetratricopeptide (TPR) repeat protein
MSQREDPADSALEQLGERFLQALGAKEAGKIDHAEDELRAILAVEPRLPEPRLELARVLLDTDRLHAAEEQAREALDHLDAGGPWTDEIPANVVVALANALLAEILRRRADEDDVIFGDPAEFRALIDESHRRFEKAAALDPSDEYASYHAFFLGVGKSAKVDMGDGLGPEDDEVP